jgi:DNA-binding HxlR family transcriptional regulator
MTVEIPFKHLGIYRTGVTREQAAIDGRVLKALFRHGRSTAASLSQRARTVERQSLDESLKRLSEWGMVEVSSTGNVESYRVALTEKGKFWAEELLAKE